MSTSFLQVALLRWLSSQSDEDRGLLTALTGIQVGKELFNRITGQDKVDAFKVRFLGVTGCTATCELLPCILFMCVSVLQRECILGISEFVRQNKRATKAEINAEVEKRVLIFAAQVKALEETPLFWNNFSQFCFSVETNNEAFLLHGTVWRRQHLQICSCHYRLSYSSRVWSL